MGIGKERNGFYYLDSFDLYSSFNNGHRHLEPRPVAHCTKSFSDLNKIDCNTWHKKLGHVSVSRMKILPFISQSFELSHCTICRRSKQTRLPFPIKHNTTSSLPFQLVHMDIWGPFHNSTHNGDKYFLTIVDDHT